MCGLGDFCLLVKLDSLHFLFVSNSSETMGQSTHGAHG